jgi:hypothetical protein
MQLMRARHTVALFMPLMLSFFSVLEISRKRKLLLAGISFMLACNLVTLIERYMTMAKPGNYKKVASYIMEHEKSDQPILIHTPDEALALGYHYKGRNPVVPLPREEDCQYYNLQKYVLGSEDEISAALSKVPGNHEYIWLLTTGTDRNCEYLGVEFNCIVLEQFARKHYRPLVDETYEGLRLRFLRRAVNAR